MNSALPAPCSPLIRPGYKQTDAGVIPEEWETHRLGELLQGPRSIRYGIVQPGKFEPTGCFMLRSQDYSKGWAGPDGMHKVSAQLENQYRNARIRHSDLIMTVVGAGIGQVVFAPDWLDGAILSRSTARIAIDEDKAAPSFVQAFLEGPVGKRQILDCQKEGAQPVVSCRDLAKFFVAYPPLPEQRAIATALSDVDALIASLDQIIAKKRDLKQAAMQQLLTGQTRLPGFKGEWEVKRLGDVLKVRHGKSQHGITAPDGKYPILASGGDIGRTNAYIYDKPSVLIGRKGTIDSPQYVDSPFWTVDTLFFTEIGSEADAKFVFHKFTIIRWRSYNEASGVPSLNAKTIENIEVPLPPLPEQTAIAEVLTDMDAELAALEQRREKTRALKQGMMQELLTGRIRLV